MPILSFIFLKTPHQQLGLTKLIMTIITLESNQHSLYLRVEYSTFLFINNYAIALQFSATFQ